MLGERAVEAARQGAAWLTDESRPPEPIGRLIKRHLGTEPRTYSGPGKGILARVEGRHLVGVRHDLTTEQARFTAAHELAHWYWEVVAKYRGRDLEARCDALGAALIAPDEAVRAAIELFGLDVARLAQSLGTTQSVALLRIGEVDGHPVALLRRRRSTIIRGRFTSWPAPLSWQPAKKTPGLVKVRITDEPTRFGVLALP